MRSWAGVGLVASVVLVVVAFSVPQLTGWEVNARSNPELAVPPLHGKWQPNFFGVGTIPAILIALLGWRYAASLAERLSWRHLLIVAYVAGLAWMIALAYVDGESGISRVLGNKYEYLITARETTDIGAMMNEFIDRIPYSHPDNWVVHIAGHPPLAFLFFIVLDRVGLGGDYAAGMVVTVLGATTMIAVLQTMRILGAESMARRAAPFLVLGPAAVFMAVSADALFAAAAAWGLCTLAVAATRESTGSKVAWSVVAGLVLGSCMFLSYGLPLLGLIALAILFLARSWLPLPITAAAALVVAGGFAVAGFAWWEAYPVLHDRYWEGLAADRPASYWMWGNLAALLMAAGPMLGAGLARLGELRGRADRVVLWLAGSATTIIVIADLSRMSKSEVERIWLPFIPWMLLSTALLPERWRRWGLGLQLLTALVMQHLLYTTW